MKQSVAVPAPGEGQVVVKVSHAAQNPTDGMHQPFPRNATPELHTLTWAEKKFNLSTGTLSATGLF